jgi:hypothetical protein
MAIARVQSTSVTTLASSNSTVLILTLGAATTDGNTVIIGIAGSINLDLKVTSTHGIFSEVTPSAVDLTTSTELVRIFYGIMFGADTSITIASVLGGALSQMSAVAAEYSGALIAPDNIPAVIGASSTNAANTGNLANTNANALYVGVIGVKVSSSTTNTAWATNNIAPFNIVAQNSTNNNTTATGDRAIVYLDAIVATSSTRGTNVNHGFGTNRYAGLLATFAQGASGGGGIRTAGHGGLAA